MHCSLYSLAVLSALLLCACGAHGMRPVVRLPRGAEGTGRYIAVLKEDTSHDRLLEIVGLLKTWGGCVVHGHVEVALKAIVLSLSEPALQKVS